MFCSSDVCEAMCIEFGERHDTGSWLDVTCREKNHLPEVWQRVAVSGLPAGRDSVEHGLIVETSKLGHRDQHVALRLGKHVGQFVLPVEVVERDCDCFGPSNCELDGHELEIVGHDDANPIARLHASGDQTIGQPSGPCIYFVIRDGSIVGDHKRSIPELLGATS